MPDGNAAPEELAVSQTPASTVLLDGTASGTKTVDWSTNGNYWSSGGGSGSGGSSGSVTVTATGSRSHG